MFKRAVFVIVWVLCIPFSVLALLFGLIGFIVAPVIWIFTGDEDKATGFMFDGRVQNTLISLPWIIMGIDD